MGLKKTTSNATWVGISEGKFTLGKGENKDKFPAFEGLLIGISFRDAEFQGKKRRDVVLLFLDETTYKVAFNVSSGYGKQTLMKLPNCDISRPIELCPTYEEVDGNKKSGMFVNQGGNSIKQKWTKDDPGQLPQSVAIDTPKGVVWDDRKQCQWLEEFIMAVVAPKCLDNLKKHADTVEHDDAEPGQEPEQHEPAKDPNSVPF